MSIAARASFESHLSRSTVSNMYLREPLRGSDSRINYIVLQDDVALDQLDQSPSVLQKIENTWEKAKTTTKQCFEVVSFFCKDSKSVRDPNKIYNRNYNEPDRVQSLDNWKKITEWRAEKKGSTGRKIVAEFLYLASAINGSMELSQQLLGAYLISNPVSEFIAKGVGLFDEEAEDNYREFKDDINKSFDKSLQGVAQNLASALTNPIGYNLNIEVAMEIKDKLEGKGVVMAEFVECISPLSIYSLVRKGDGRGLVKDLQDF